MEADGTKNTNTNLQASILVIFYSFINYNEFLILLTQFYDTAVIIYVVPLIAAKNVYPFCLLIDLIKI